MSQELTVANPQQLAQQLATRAQAMSAGSSDYPFIKMDKTGSWIYGADEVEVQDGSIWAINPNSFVEGYVCWGEGEVLGEEMAPMTGQPIILANLPNVGGKRGWEKQTGFMMACLNGEDKGEQVIYKTSSKGGQKAVKKLIDKVVTQIGTDPVNIVPHVTMNADSYKHPTYGKIFNPIFEVVAWSAVSATVAPEAEKAEATAKASETIQKIVDENTPEELKEPEAPKVVKKRKRRAIAD